MISLGQIPQPTQLTGISGTIINPDTGEVLEGVRIPFVDADGNIVAATSGVDGNFQVETGAGTYTMNKVIFNETEISISEVIFNVTIGEIYNIGTVGVNRVTSITVSSG